MAKIVFAVILSCLVAYVLAQENADTNIAKSLKECYNNTQYIDSNKKRPMTMNYLIDLIRKVENGPDRMDIQKLSTSMLHRFRQDGILRAVNTRDSSILPFSPYGDENKKFRILLESIVPSSYLFPNDTLSPMERCTIHLMLSESVETILRGDEAQVCSRTGRYRLRTRRNVETPDEDVEMIIPSHKQGNKGNMQLNPDDVTMVNPRKATEPQKPQSPCPLEYGVVYTKWGAVSAGSIIAGIAAGSEPQIINIKQNFGTERDAMLDNIWGATLAGNIAEAAYFSSGNNKDIIVGADGSWDSTQVPHGYYLTKNDDLYFTDAEIRGDLDGLILGTKMKEFRNSARNMKLSQLLDMYYSERGVFNSNIKACKRNELLTEFAPTKTIEEQGFAFALILHKKVTLMTSMNEDSVNVAVKDATNKFSTYVPGLRDLSCINNNEYLIVRTEIMILLDFSFQYESVDAILNTLLHLIDINPYNSNYTLVNAQTGEVIIESSDSFSSFIDTFNKTLYDQQNKGFDLSASLGALERLTAQKMERERLSKEPTSRSLIGLLVANNPSAGNSNKEFAIARVNDIIRPKYPDLRLLALSTGPKEFFTNIVKDTTKDIITIQDNPLSENIVNSIGQLVTRIKQIPSRIISYKCTGNWTMEGEDKPITHHVTPNSINYYRVSPNYFYQGDNPRYVKIRGQGQSVLHICHSRSVELPNSNGGNIQNVTQGQEQDQTNTGSQGGVICKQVTNEEVTIELKDPCYDVYTIMECAPLYFSVEAKEVRSGSFETCTDKNCRYTDNIKFTISTENFGCFSSANILFTNFIVLISMLVIVRNIN